MHLLLLVLLLLLMTMLHSCWRLRQPVARKAHQLSMNLKMKSTGGSFFNEKFVQQIDILDYDNEKRPVTVLDIPHELDNLENLPTVVLLGTAQTVQTFVHHCREFSRHSRLVVPELRCQGTTNLLTNNCSIDQQVIDMERILNELDIKKCNLVGFSFGGRVAIAFAVAKSSYVHKLSLSGVPLTRPALGSAILQSWENDLKSGIIPAWSFVLNGYSDSYLHRHAEKLHAYAEYVKEQNCPGKLKDLITSTNQAGSDNDSPFSVKSCSAVIRCPTQIIAGTHDRISGLKDVMDLAQEIRKHGNKNVEYEEINSGHIQPFENIVGWRNLVLEFLKKKY